MNYRLNNKSPGGPVRFDLTRLLPEFHFAEGMIPVPLSLDDRVGSETAFILFDRTRYTFHPAARRELLTRLLKLNHTRAAEEQNATLAAGPKSKKPQRAKKEDELL